jgi:hypothetical protein
MRCFRETTIITGGFHPGHPRQLPRVLDTQNPESKEGQQMGKLIVMNQITVNGAFEAPSPDDWLVLDEDSSEASLEQLMLAEAMVLGRKTFEGLAAVWPQLANDPAMARFAERLNPMPKYVASRTLTEPLEWNASLIKGTSRRPSPH